MSREHWIVILTWIEWLQSAAAKHSPKELLGALRAADAALAGNEGEK